MEHETPKPGPEFIKPFVPSAETQRPDDEIERRPVSAERMRELRKQMGIVVSQEISKPVEVSVHKIDETDSKPTINYVPEPENERERIISPEERDEMIRRAHIANRLGGNE